MRIEKRRWEDVVVLTFIGEADGFRNESFSAKIETLVEAGHIKLAFDLHLIAFVNTTALGFLVRTKKLVEERGGALVIAQPSDSVRNTFEMLGLDELFRIFDRDVDAVSHLLGTDDASIDLNSLPVETDDRLIGVRAVIFHLLDASPAGADHSVGRIVSLDGHGLVFRWRIPAPGDGAADAGITTENVDRKLVEGTRLHVKLRQPLAVKSRFLEAECRVTRIEEEIEEGGGVTATIALEYVGMGPGDGPFELHQGAPLRPPSPADLAHARPDESSS